MIHRISHRLIRKALPPTLVALLSLSKVAINDLFGPRGPLLRNTGEVVLKSLKKFN